MERREALAEEQLSNERRKKEEACLKLKQERLSRKVDADTSPSDEKELQADQLREENKRLQHQVLISRKES